MLPQDEGFNPMHAALTFLTAHEDARDKTELLAVHDPDELAEQLHSWRQYAPRIWARLRLDPDIRVHLMDTLVCPRCRHAAGLHSGSFGCAGRNVHDGIPEDCTCREFAARILDPTSSPDETT
jgi:hypothetical protein